MTQNYTIQNVIPDQLVRDCGLLGDPSTYRWKATLIGWDGAFHRKLFYDSRLGGR